ncbi:hypothetical protein OVN18_03635 [Microcella daejeonensis]|uniref:Uncharacterized protein n=1 Tax=Microcella daejeonensis TaxID=2994971 RepID=A0A9E8MMB0_9MICO|nr:hypothetical protein [Microcella daejeonensis]WAB82113.1 hypothetical protein OVN18_03635 [Microcella daejeonensis]
MTFLGRRQGPSRPTPPVAWFAIGASLLVIGGFAWWILATREIDASGRASAFFFLLPIIGVACLVAGVVAVVRRR